MNPSCFALGYLPSISSSTNVALLADMACEWENGITERERERGREREEMALYDCSMCVCLAVSETASVFREKSEFWALGAGGWSVKDIILMHLHTLNKWPLKTSVYWSYHKNSSKVTWLSIYMTHESVCLSLSVCVCAAMCVAILANKKSHLALPISPWYTGLCVNRS